MIDEFRIREAAPEDAEAIAAVQIKTWQHAYAHIFPSEMLTALDEELPFRIKRWETIIHETASLASALVVAETGTGEVVGFASGGKQAESGFRQDAEIYAIYLLPEFHRKGTGRRLFTAAAGKLKQLGYSSLLLWVLADNSASRGFYEHLGGRLSGEKDYPLWGVTYPLVAYAWDSLDTLTGD